MKRRRDMNVRMHAGEAWKCLSGSNNTLQLSQPTGHVRDDLYDDRTYNSPGPCRSVILRILPLFEGPHKPRPPPLIPALNRLPFRRITSE